MDLTECEGVDRNGTEEAIKEIKHNMDKYFATCLVEPGTKDVASLLKVHKDNRQSPGELEHIAIVITGKAISLSWAANVIEEIVCSMGFEDRDVEAIVDCDYNEKKIRVSVYGKT